MLLRSIAPLPILLVFWLGAGVTARGEDQLDEIVKRYREALKDASPAELYSLKGEQLFRRKTGPRNVSLDACDFGLGPGLVKGAYAQLPRYFSDTDKVEDLESRLMSCMARLQGFTADAFPRHARSDPQRMADFEALAAFVASESEGMKLAAPLRHPKEIEAYRIGERLFYRRAGSHDFSCANCHTAHGKRIRLQRLPHLTDPKEAQTVFPTWPAYRVESGNMTTMQFWITTCYYQTRYPQLQYGSDGAIALQVFMAQHANGGVITAPDIKR